MKLIHTVVASFVTVAALALSTPAYAESVTIEYPPQTDRYRAIPDKVQQRDEVMKLFTAHLGLWLTRDPNGYPYERLITEDAVFEYPYAEAESARYVAGRAGVADTLRKLPRAASDWRYDEVKVFQTAQPDVFFVAYKLSAPQHDYAQSFMARITVRNGQIANYYELWDETVAGATAAISAHD